MAGALFTHSPLQGQVNLLTTGAFDAPGELLQLERTRGVAFFRGRAGRIARRLDGQGRAQSGRSELVDSHRQLRHARRRRGTAISSACRTACTATRAATPRRSRRCPKRRATSARCTRTTTGRVSERITIGYGGHYAHYDYLVEPAHLSPRLSATIQPTEHTRLRAVATRQVQRPGAEEFLPPSRAQVLPPQRTFAPLTRTGFLPEDMQHYEVGVEQRARRRHASACARSSRRSTISWSRCSGCARRTRRRAEIGHYFVGSAGDVDVRGWGVTLHARAARQRARLGRLLARRRRVGEPTVRSIAGGWRARAVGALRDDDERIHDLTTSLETDVPQSATRVFLLYKMNSAYIRADGIGIAARPRRPLGRAGQPGAAVHELHERRLGDAGRRSQSLPRIASPKRRSTTNCSSLARPSASSAASRSSSRRSGGVRPRDRQSRSDLAIL